MISSQQKRGSKVWMSKNRREEKKSVDKERNEVLKRLGFALATVILRLIAMTSLFHMAFEKLHKVISAISAR
ncbi:hypothetical protein ABEG10_25195 [Burkholderia cenocepacia]|uniref:hypothetical protein n=1 Tax=Burkholderia cenocepacia TaxID=95486 RepID=UPI0020A2218A|nr:hypothetical protein [Burkholderia cenocepacia]MCO8321476.1 hypothetical protein [Burkholderia cenocepacia]MCO8328760.1 hypothetical protein [Burkholderia cenocepacia]MCO8336046.1 hypothetical protein [Burkholderia cenocepacia]MCO8343331.1 hypothetical protein [Burkholderia cenocepacia]MCO8356613.1 hypothetical protein [Burkholderia cenocepacia]